jgi:NAD(P)-dependent dehydrogenase (short-subunit alcohol dehydrogenase family)
MRLTGKVALITGAARGIGRAIAAAMAGEGAQVMLTDRDGAAAKKTAAELAIAGGIIQAFCLDVTDRVQVAEVTATIFQTTGRIDILVNNAGVVGVATFLDTSPAEWDRIMTTNLKGVFHCCQAVLPQMAERRQGKIINIASVAAKVGGGLLGTSTYAASKAGVIGLSKGLAREFASRGVNVNVIAPGSINTDLTQRYLSAQQQLDSVKRIPLGRRGLPADIAGAAVFLASDESDFITGATIDINGGVLMD